ncbi:hypothetical protein [Nocardioides sp.]|uniref:hypothetical protein n=1 Tax=Nocardioides sp. TaxID=35761 RepID=UPI0035633234
MTGGRIVLLGDSHLARVRRDLDRLACGDSGPADIVNAAVGGADARDLLAQATAAGVGADDRVAVSIGTNDAAPWKQLPLAEGIRRLHELFAQLHPERIVQVASPGVDEERLGREFDRTNELMTAYALLLPALRDALCH